MQSSTRPFTVTARALRDRVSVAAVLGDRRGSVAIVTALIVPTLIGFVGLGTEIGLWMYARQEMQGAADSAALGGATANMLGDKTKTVSEGKTAAARYGLVDGASGVVVKVNQPPTTGNFTANASAVEVIIAQPQPRLFSALFLSSDVTVRARAVAIAGKTGNACVLALDPAAKGALTASGSATVTLNGCSIAVNSSDPSAALLTQGSSIITTESAKIVGGITNSGGSKIVTTDGIVTGAAVTSDPYANVALPSAGSCDQTKFSTKNTVTLSPGVFCNGFKLNAGANVTLNPGTYIINGGAFDIAGGATMSGSGVTFVFTNSATANINGGAAVTLSAPTTGSLAGIAMFADRDLPSSTTFSFNGGSTQNITGAIYGTSVALQYNGGVTTGAVCTQLVARTITFTGNAVVNPDCTGKGTRAIGTTASALVE
jgi:Flp pilus assembly protein TadG